LVILHITYILVSFTFTN